MPSFQTRSRRTLSSNVCWYSRRNWDEVENMLHPSFIRVVQSGVVLTSHEPCLTCYTRDCESVTTGRLICDSVPNGIVLERMMETFQSLTSLSFAVKHVFQWLLYKKLQLSCLILILLLHLGSMDGIHPTMATHVKCSLKRWILWYLKAVYGRPINGCCYHDRMPWLSWSWIETCRAIPTCGNALRPQMQAMSCTFQRHLPYWESCRLHRNCKGNESRMLIGVKVPGIRRRLVRE